MKWLRDIPSAESRYLHGSCFGLTRPFLYAIFLARLPQVPMSHQRLEPFFVRRLEILMDDCDRGHTSFVRCPENSAPQLLATGLSGHHVETRFHRG